MVLTSEQYVHIHRPLSINTPTLTHRHPNQRVLPPCINSRLSPFPFAAAGLLDFSPFSFAHSLPPSSTLLFLAHHFIPSERVKVVPHQIPPVIPSISGSKPGVSHRCPFLLLHSQPLWLSPAPLSPPSNKIPALATSSPETHISSTEFCMLVASFSQSIAMSSQSSLDPARRLC